jgi:hypothetical protein
MGIVALCELAATLTVIGAGLVSFFAGPVADVAMRASPCWA